MDGQKRQVDSLTSDVGHLLWSGIVEDRRASATVRRLMRHDMFSGWGIRSMSAENAGYNPLVYHTGTVWPHDTAIVAEGMRRYGFRDEPPSSARQSWTPPKRFRTSYPEVFAGFPRDETGMPVEYPQALKPQSWAAGTPLLVIRTLLGLDPADGDLRCDPHLPKVISTLTLSRVSFRGRHVDPS